LASLVYFLAGRGGQKYSRPKHDIEQNRNVFDRIVHHQQKAVHMRCGPRQLGSTPTVPHDRAHAPYTAALSRDISSSAFGFVTTPSAAAAAADITRFCAVLYRAEQPAGRIESTF